MKKFYATLSANQGGPGYIEIDAKDENEARELVNKFTDGRWAFMYESVEEIHEFDRKLIAVIK